MFVELIWYNASLSMAWGALWDCGAAETSIISQATTITFVEFYKSAVKYDSYQKINSKICN